MTDDDNIRRLWHEQPREERAMSIDEIRARARRFDERVRGWKVTGALLLAAIVVVELIQICSRWPRSSMSRLSSATALPRQHGLP